MLLISGTENKLKVERETSSNISLIINILCNATKTLMFIYKGEKRKTEEHEGDLFTSSYLTFTVFWLLVLSLVSQTVKSLNWVLSRGKCG